MPTRAFATATLLSLAGCNWISLASNALTYETLRPGDAGNVVAADSVAYVTLADSGVAIVDAAAGGRLTVIPPPRGLESVDALAISDGMLVLLDARPPGHVAVMSLAMPTRPRAVGDARAVDVGPFSGLSAGNGMVAVSGGTSPLSLWRYDSAGISATPVATGDYGRGQPDVLITRSHQLLVSTHYWGPYFGVDVARFDGGSSLSLLGKLELEGAGFSAGGAKPANFPMKSAQLDDSTFVLAYGRGVGLIVVDSGGVPRLDALLDVGGPAVNVDVLERSAAVAVAGNDAAIVLVDLAGKPRVSRRIDLPPGTIPSGVALTSRSVIVAARGNGVRSFAR